LFQKLTVTDGVLLRGAQSEKLTPEIKEKHQKQNSCNDPPLGVFHNIGYRFPFISHA
jgi:hypothetical protein